MRDSKLFDIAYLISDLMILNLLWIVFSLPVVTVFQSTEALFHSIRLLRKDEGSSVWREFWNGFTKHFWWMLINFVITVAVILILYVDVRFFIQQNTVFAYILAGLLLSMGLMFLITLIYTFLTIQYYEGKLFGLWKTSFLLGLGYLPQTILILVILIVALFIIQIIPILFFIILVSGSAYLIDMIFGGIIKKYIKRDEE
ncbi:YesL family protein [Thermoanaerobacter uzonensis]|uniref:YesL family protein n=1 Tax=Thermoanaerobacter uzonensis TaxID=447593 RepID=UPI003D7681E1